MLQISVLEVEKSGWLFIEVFANSMFCTYSFVLDFSCVSSLVMAMSSLYLEYPGVNVMQQQLFHCVVSLHPK